MSNRDMLGTRMKENYEHISKTRLLRRCPVIIRVDGKAFHTITRNLKKPFDDVLVESMQSTMKYLCENIQGAVLGYTQSDEISILVVDYKKLESSAWFDNEVQKICSVSASMATASFCLAFNECADLVISENKDTKYQKSLLRLRVTPKCFDSRCFNVPREEVTNYFYWRQLDAIRNSIEMQGRAFFSQRELYKKSCSDIQAMLYEHYHIDWDTLPIHLQRGSCCIKERYIQDNNTGEVFYDYDTFSKSGSSREDCSIRSRWVVDKEIPIFTNDGRDYIDKLVLSEERMDSLSGVL